MEGLGGQGGEKGIGCWGPVLGGMGCNGLSENTEGNDP